MTRPTDLLQGTLDLLILQTLSWGPAHGYAVARWIEQLTGEVLRVGEGSLYPALHRLEERKWVDAMWELSDTGRRTRVYRLTAKGWQPQGATAGCATSTSSAATRGGISTTRCERTSKCASPPSSDWASRATMPW